MVQTFLICILCSLLNFLVTLFPPYIFADEYKFDISETEKKPYYLGGYTEFSPALLGLDKDASLYKLRFYNRDEGDTLDEYNLKLQLEGSYEKDISRLFIRTNTEYKKSYLDEFNKTSIYEGYLSLKPSPAFTIDFGKKTLKWGKGYAWSPVAFIDRPKDTNDPEASLEGYIVTSADYIKSFNGPLKTLSITPVLIPVHEQINDNFGEINELNFAGKLYLLLYDTDIDFIVLIGGSKTTRYGFDFSRNITSNFEIHGEFALINNYKKRLIESDGSVSETIYDAKSYLMGIRYLTKSDITYILEFYRNGTGYTSNEMQDYFSIINQGYESYRVSGDNTLLQKAINLTEGNYGKENPMRNYVYFRVSQQEPFDILYFTPSLTWIYNIDDKSYSLSPEILYTGITNLELRLKAAFISGQTDSEYGEKQNDYKVELRVRYYFKLFG
jgi:hypothetical protein